MFNLFKIKVITIITAYLLSVIIVGAVYFNYQPNWLPDLQLNLGLDLRGGAQILFEYDYDKYTKQSYQQTVRDLRNELRRNKVKYKKLSFDGNKIKFSVVNDIQINSTEKLLARNFPHLTVEKDNQHFKLVYETNYLNNRNIKLNEQIVNIIDRRVNEHGTIEPVIQSVGKNRIDVQVPGVESPDQIKKLIGKTAKLEFFLVNNNADIKNVPLNSFKSHILIDNNKLPIALYKNALMNGDDLVDAQVSLERGAVVVNFKLTPAGTRKFAAITSKNVGKQFAIVLDKQVISAPTIREPILTGSGVIQGSFSMESAKELALLLRAGALPVNLELIEERVIGPSLGIDSINSGIKAATLSFILVGLFMILRYKILGIFSLIALILNLIMLMAVLSLVGASLTLPGIAGIVLTIGMAVDANVLIFERIKEELKAENNKVKAAFDGFNNAFRAILDSNITTLIVAIMLYYFGNGPVKGFAVTLSLGIFSSMLASISLTKLMVDQYNKR